MQADTTELNEIVHSHRSVDAGVSGGLSAIIFYLYFNHSDGELQECKKKEYL